MNLSNFEGSIPKKMVLKKVDIVQKLKIERGKNSGIEKISMDIRQILDHVSENRSRIKNSLTSTQKELANDFQFDFLETERIFHLSHIRKICIDYRLRFLDTKYFKGDIPEEAISKISSLQKIHCTQIKNFKIVAPSKLFKLNNMDDPLLFAPMGNGYFYLIHKWGNDLHPLRKFAMWPFKNIVNLTVVVFFISYLATYLVPEGLFSKTGSAAEFWIIFLFIFKSVAAIVIFYGFALGKNFSPSIWNQKYFNA